MLGDITDNEITEAQLKELDKILVEINKPIKNGHPDFLGDDDLMIKAVSNAARYFNGEDNTFLEDIVHVKSSYEDTKWVK